MPDYLLDTGILIRHLRQNPGYQSLLERLAQDGIICITSLTRTEIIRAMRDRERKSTYSLLDSLDTLSLDKETADLAGELIRTLRKNGITLHLPDAVIAATAMLNRFDLITTNPKDFLMPELTVWQADEQGNINPKLHVPYSPGL